MNSKLINSEFQREKIMLHLDHDKNHVIFYMNFYFPECRHDLKIPLISLKNEVPRDDFKIEKFDLVSILPCYIFNGVMEGQILEACPFCHEKAKLITLPDSKYIPFLTRHMPFSHVICEECKSKLDKDGIIKDDTGTYGFITNDLYTKKLHWIFKFHIRKMEREKEVKSILVIVLFL